MARNKLEDLNDHLFEQLERLNDDELTQEQLEHEVKRSKAMGDIAKNIIDNARTALDGAKLIYNNRDGGQPVPTQFQISHE